MENLLQQLRSPSSKGRKQKRGQATSVTLPQSTPEHSLPSSGLKVAENKKVKSAAATGAAQLGWMYMNVTLQQIRFVFYVLLFLFFVFFQISQQKMEVFQGRVLPG